MEDGWTRSRFAKVETVVKLKAIVEDQEHELDVRIDGASVSAEIDGRVYDLELREPEPGKYLFLRGVEVHECLVNKTSEGFEVNLHARKHAVTIVDPKRLRSGQDSHGHHHGLAEITAPMPGKVVKVQIEAGMNVEKGAGIVVVEAMKMQNEVKAAAAGKVLSLSVREGAAVAGGDTIAVIG